MSHTLEDAEFMKIALEEAREAFFAGEVPIGAVAVEDGKIIARARNRVEECASVSCHAEFEVIRQVEKLRGDWRMQGITIYVTKEPCPMCAGMLVNCRVNRIVYGLSDSKTGGCGGAIDIPGMENSLWHPDVTANVLAEESLALIQEFFQNRRQKKGEFPAKAI